LTIRHLAAVLGVNLLVGTNRIGTNVTNNSPIVLNMPMKRHILGANFATAKKHAFAPSGFSLRAGSTSIFYVVGTEATRSLALIRQTY
jgi:hypothetical protein